MDKELLDSIHTKTFTKVHLGEIVSVVQNGLYKTADFYGHGHPFIRMYNVQDDAPQLNLKPLAQVDVDQSELETYALRVGDILVSRVNSLELLGKSGFVNAEAAGHVFENMLIRLRVNDVADPFFITLQLGTEAVRKQIRAFAKKASGQASVNSTDIRNLEIVLPPLEKQRRIADIAMRADRLRRTRRYAQQLSDSYLQSVFLEMFGDPVSNPKGWTRTSIEEISTKVTDGEHTTPKRTSSGIKLLSARNIQNGYLDFATGLDFIPKTEYERIKKRCHPELGDILISCSGSIGRVTTVDTIEPLPMVRSVALVKPRHDLLVSKYLEHFLRSSYSQYMIERSAHQSSQANLFTGQIKELPVLLPPFTLQQKFTAIVQRFERLRTQQHEADRQAEHLFQSILHRAFRGEL